MVIAWIEDDIHELNPVMEPLVERGFTFKKFRNYQHAVDSVESLRSADLIILDLILPSGKNIDSDDYLGVDLLRRLRKEFHIATPVLIFSVVAHASDILSVDDARELNVRAVAKPVKQERLLREVYGLLGLPFVSDDEIEAPA